MTFWVLGATLTFGDSAEKGRRDFVSERILFSLTASKLHWRPLKSGALFSLILFHISRIASSVTGGITHLLS